MKVTILGCHSATPRENAHPTAQFLEMKGRHFLIDCGEGTQMQLRKYHLKFTKINHVFISHLHGDHFYGLIGFLSTLGILGRTKDLHVYGPKGLKELITLQLRLTASYNEYHIVFHELESKDSELIFEDDKVQVFTIPLKHRVYTNGFLFQEKIGERKLDIEAVAKYQEIEICDYQNLKNGKDFTLKNGETIANELLTKAPTPPLSYAFCSDTKYKESIVPIIKNVSMLYHEATFLEERSDLAKKTMHSTALEAGKIARLAETKKLILGHYSSRYSDISAFQKEAQEIFENVHLAEAGKVITL